MIRSSRFTSWALILAWSLLAGPPPARAEDDAHAVHDAIYVRLDESVGGVVKWLDDETERLDAAQILVVLDAPTFSPPPGANEFNVPDGLAGQRTAWTDTLDLWARTTERPIRATTTIAAHSVRLGQDGAAEAFGAMAGQAWWDDTGGQQVDPAWRWMTRLLKRNRTGPRLEGAKGPRVLVYVTGRFPPERYVEGGQTDPAAEAWRTRLPGVGDHWETESLGELLQGQGVRLYVVGPEVFLGQENPYAELPVLPWAARPRRVPPALVAGGSIEPWLEWGGRVRGGRADDPAAVPLPRPPSRDLRERLRDGPGRDRIPWRSTVHPVLVPSHRAPARYLGAPSAFFDAASGQIPFHDHTPSGFGWWPYARTVAKTGGRYVLLAARTEELVDRPPRDDALLARLAPELVGRRAYAGLRKGDGALHLLSRLSVNLEQVTPWADTWPSEQTLRAWSAWERAAPALSRSDEWDLHRAPYALFRAGTRGEALREAQRIRERVLPRYDHALASMDRFLERLAAGEDLPAHPRSVANLRLARFHIAQSAFHLESWAVSILALPEGPANTRVELRLLPVLRLSDGLPAYDGRELGGDAEAGYERWLPPDAPGTYPGNLLGIPGDHPDFRARRSLGRILQHFEEPLRRRALVMIGEAEDVMDHLAETPWGESVYHAEAFWFDVRVDDEGR